MKQKLLLSCFMLASFIGIAQNVTIPDVNFKSYLVNNPAINTNGTNGDTEIQVAEAIAFSGTINVFNLGITDLTGIEAFINLEGLIVQQNQLTILDISANVALKELRLDFNSISTIDVTSNTNLEVLAVGSNPITTLNISQNTSLTEINFTNNTSLLDVDLSNNTNLTKVIASNSGFSTFDLSNNGLLQDVLFISNANLTAINLGNGNTAAITSANFQNNANLNCIEVDTGFTPPTSWSTFNSPNASFSNSCFPVCTVTIPDANFKNLLLNSIDANGSGEIECSEASAYSGSLAISDAFGTISDFTGLEAFTEVTGLEFFSSSTVQVLDLSNNTKIESLDIFSENFTSIDISALTVLDNLSINNVQTLTTLDLSTNTALKDVSINNLPLNTIDFSNLINLESVRLDTGQFSSIVFNNNGVLDDLRVVNQPLLNIDISGLSNLQNLLFEQNNQLTSIDISNNINLETLTLIENTSVTLIDLSQNINLEYFEISDTNFASIDLSNNTLLDFVFLYDNSSLVNFDIANGNNSNIQSPEFLGNTSLTCIQIDAGFTPSNNWLKDATASYSDDCAALLCIVNIPDASFKNILVSNTAINLNVDTEIQCSEAAAYTGLITNTNGLINPAITDFTGLEAFTEITELVLTDSSSNVQNLDLSANTKIESLTIFQENFTTIDISTLTVLENIYFNNFQTLSALDLTNNLALRTFRADRMDLNTIDFTGLINLESVEMRMGTLTSATFTNNPLLNEITIIQNQLSNIDVTSLSDLVVLNLFDNQLSTLNVTQNTDLEFLGVAINNNLTTLDVTQNSVLTGLRVGDNNLATLDLSQNTNLLEFYLNGTTNFTTIDLSNNSNIWYLESINSSLTALDLSANILLEEIYINDNTNLVNLNLANANNSTLLFADLTGNPNLPCVQIDAGFTPPTNGNWVKDASASYSDNCANLSVNDLETSDFKIYPNPVSELLTLESNATIEALEVYSVLGKKVTHSQNTNQIDASELNSGVYFLKIYSENGAIATQRFVKQ